MKNKKVVFEKEWQVALHDDASIDIDLQSTEVFIKTEYSLISAGTELACLAGKESAWFHFPETPGYCAVGVIEAVGADVSGLAVGDKVFFYGAHQAYSKIDVAEELCVKVPAGLDAKFAPFARIATIAMTSIRVSDIELGDNVIVGGMGIVGNVAAQLAQLQGANVLGIDLDEKRLETASECGIGLAKMVSQMQFESAFFQNGVQAYIDATGSAKAVTDILPFVERGGEVILLGTPRDELMFNVTDTLRQVHLADRLIRFKGALEWTYPVKQNNFVKHSFERNTRIALDLIASGKLNLAPLLTHVLTPEDAVSAYEGLKEKKNEYIGVVFDWTQN